MVSKGLVIEEVTCVMIQVDDGMAVIIAAADAFLSICSDII